MFPPHHQLYIMHNEHHVNYETIQEYLECRKLDGDSFDEEEVKKCVESNSIWEIQLYPISPISFYWVFASTFEGAIKLINEAAKETT